LQLSLVLFFCFFSKKKKACYWFYVSHRHRTMQASGNLYKATTWPPIDCLLGSNKIGSLLRACSMVAPPSSYQCPRWCLAPWALQRHGTTAPSPPHSSTRALPPPLSSSKNGTPTTLPPAQHAPSSSTPTFIARLPPCHRQPPPSHALLRFLRRRRQQRPRPGPTFSRPLCAGSTSSCGSFSATSTTTTMIVSRQPHLLAL
jgi:hypothetical protein